MTSFFALRMTLWFCISRRFPLCSWGSLHHPARRKPNNLTDHAIALDGLMTSVSNIAACFSALFCCDASLRALLRVLRSCISLWVTKDVFLDYAMKLFLQFWRASHGVVPTDLFILDRSISVGPHSSAPSSSIPRSSLICSPCSDCVSSSASLYVTVCS